MRIELPPAMASKNRAKNGVTSRCEPRVIRSSRACSRETRRSSAADTRDASRLEHTAATLRRIQVPSSGFDSGFSVRFFDRGSEHLGSPVATRSGTRDPTELDRSLEPRT